MEEGDGPLKGFWTREEEWLKLPQRSWGSHWYMAVNIADHVHKPSDGFTRKHTRGSHPRSNMTGELARSDPPPSCPDLCRVSLHNQGLRSTAGSDCAAKYVPLPSARCEPLPHHSSLHAKESPLGGRSKQLYRSDDDSKMPLVGLRQSPRISSDAFPYLFAVEQKGLVNAIGLHDPVSLSPPLSPSPFVLSRPRI